ncbi:MAG TPA: MFS transporter [Streptosporangiaceae bacterium]|nr:MFS transporter [Streptosporangiaceae bacterium]
MQPSPAGLRRAVILSGAWVTIERTPAPEIGVEHMAEMRRARVAVLAYFFLLGMVSAVWVARIPAIKHRLELTDGSLGVALLAMPVGLVLVMPICGRLVDRFGSGRVTRPAAVAFALALPPLGLAGNLVSLVAGLLVFGLVSGLLDVAMNAHAVRVERGYGRPIMASFHAVFSVGGLAGALFGGLFAALGVSPAVTFLAAGLPMSVVGVVAGRLLLPSPDPAGAAGAGIDDAVGSVDATAGSVDAAAARAAADTASAGRPRRPGVVVALLGVVAFCCLVGEGAADNWSAVYLHDELGTSQGFAALGFAAFSITMTIGRLAGDRLALRFGPVRLVRGCGLLAAVGLAGGLLADQPIGGLAGFAALGAGLSCIVPQVFSAAGNADPARAGRNLARVAGLGYLGLVSGPALIGGAASVVGLPVALGIPVLLAIGVAASAGAVRRPAAGLAPGSAAGSTWGTAPGSSAAAPPHSTAPPPPPPA